ncbi:MAG: hypothetical protein JO250_18160 [Armatimonadetes bacterium]|nr:hypothetical protein [Armatimonadota bacterium]
MELPFQRDKVTTISTVVDLSSDPQPSITLVDYVDGPGGAARHFTQTVPVNDLLLFSRLTSEVSRGDQLEVTIVNEWYDTGAVTYLLDFAKPAPRQDLLSQEAEPLHMTTTAPH